MNFIVCKNFFLIFQVDAKMTIEAVNIVITKTRIGKGRRRRTVKTGINHHVVHLV